MDVFVVLKLRYPIFLYHHFEVYFGIIYSSKKKTCPILSSTFKADSLKLYFKF